MHARAPQRVALNYREPSAGREWRQAFIDDTGLLPQGEGENEAANKIN